MLMKNRILFILLCMFYCHGLMAQSKCDKYVIIKMNINYSNNEFFDSYWLIPEKSILDANIKVYPLFVDTLSYNIIDAKKDTIPYLRANMQENGTYKIMLNEIVRKIEARHLKIQEIKKKWFISKKHFDSYIGKPTTIEVYATPIYGSFVKKTIAYSSTYANSLKYSDRYIPTSAVEIDESFWNTDAAEYLKIVDFCILNPFILIPKEMINHSIQPINVQVVTQ